MSTPAMLEPTVCDPTIPTPSPTSRSLVAWAEEARAAAQIATSMVKTSFVPASYRNKAEEATAAMLAGAELGLSPIAALQAYDVIQGTPAMRAATIRGLVQSHGHHIWVEPTASDTEVTACGRRRDSEEIQRSTWSIERAQRMGLTSKANWKTQPQAMLTARATSEVCRLIAADVLLGVPYSAEELADTGSNTTHTIRRKTKTPPTPPQPTLNTDPATDGQDPEAGT